MNTEVKVVFFKQSGTYNYQDEFFTELDTWQTNEINEEIVKNYANAVNNDFVVEASCKNKTLRNSWLVKNINN